MQTVGAKLNHHRTISGCAATKSEFMRAETQPVKCASWPGHIAVVLRMWMIWLHVPLNGNKNLDWRRHYDPLETAATTI